MHLFARVKSFLGAQLRPHRVDRDLEDELAFHLEERTRDLLSRGLSRADAEARAVRELGDATKWRVEAREARGRRLLDELATDMAIARTAVVRNRSHSVAAVAVIAIGMTAATHMANEFNAAFWRPLPVRSPESLRTLVWASPRTGFLNTPAFEGPQLDGRPTFASVWYPVYKAVRDESGVFSELACWMDPGETLPVVMGELGVGSVSFVSGNFFTTLGVNPALGRLLTPDDDSETVPVPVAILSERFWRATFGGDPDVLDKRLTLNGTPFRIVGVAESGFFGLDPSHAPDVMVPIGMLHIAAAGGPGVLQTQANWSVCRMVGRLRDGVSDDAARAAAQAAMLRSVTTTPKWPPRGRVYDWPTLAIIPIERGLDGLRAAAGRPMLIVSIVVGVLLAIAVANVAGLLLARGVAREPEVATRLALGAGRARVLRQFIGEALLLSSAGGAIGFMLSSILSAWMPSLLAQLAPTFHASSRPLGVSIAPELRVAALSFGASVIAALIFGALPALRAARLSLSEAARGAAASRPGRSVAGHVVVALQAALAMFLVVGAAMFVRTVTNLQSVDLGFTTDRLLYVRVEPRGGGLRTGADGLTAGDYARRRAALFQEVLEPLGAAPGVIAASATITPPLAAYDGAGASDESPVACTTYVNATTAPDASYVSQQIAPRFFETLQLPILRGRDFTWADRSPGRQTVGIVNEAFVRRFFPKDVDPIGATYGIGQDCPANPGRPTIIAVVADSRPSPRAPAVPMLYQRYGTPATPLTVILRTSQDPAAVIPSVRRVMQEFRPALPLFGEVAVDDLVNHEIRQERLVRALLVIFAAVALLLTCFGVYAVMAYRVGRRATEIGVRLALGARPRQIATLLMRESLWPVAVGVVAGAAISVLASRAVQTMLFGVAFPDLLTIGLGGSTLLAIAAIGCIRPIMQACGIDLVKALRAV